MRLSLAILALTVFLSVAVAGTRPAGAVTVAHRQDSKTAGHQQAEVDDNDDTRVEVQLVVLGIAAGSVFVLGSGAYLLRRKLGLVAPPPDQSGAGHH